MDNGRMRLRSSVTDEERAEIKSKENRKKQQRVDDKRPFIQYSGEVRYFTTQLDCAIWCDTILKQANDSSDIFVIGFDMEWPFSYETGPGKTAVIQISSTVDVCYIFHVSTLKTLPKSLTELLAHDKVRLTGVNIKNDIRKLSRDFPGIDAEKAIQNCVDASSLANNILSVRRRWSMEKLVDEFFDMRINKDKKVRNSRWHVIPLSKEQQIYAAIDAYASLKLYHHLKNMETEVLTKETDILTLTSSE